MPKAKKDNPNPKPSFIKSFLFGKDYKEITYENFNFEMYKDVRDAMTKFRQTYEPTWRTIRDSYLPEKVTELGITATWTVDTDGNAVPDRLFAKSSSDNSDMQDMKEPIIAIKIHTALSILTQRTPDVVWDSDNETYAARVEVLDALRKNDWSDDQTRQQYVMLWFYDIMYGTTYWRRYFEHEEREVNFVSSLNPITKEVEYKTDTLVEINQTVGEALSPWQVWIDPDTRPGRPRSMRKARYDKVYSYSKFRRLFKDLARKEDLDKVQPTTVDGYEGDWNVRCEYFEDIDLDMEYVVANDVPILKRHLPANHKGLSINKGIWLPRAEDDDPMGLGPMEMLLPSKKNVDTLHSMTLNQLRFSIFKSMFYRGSLQVEGGEDGEIHMAPDTAYKTSDPDSIKFLEIPGPGKEAWQGIESERARVDDACGINEPLSGTIADSTAYGIDVAKDAALARLGVPIGNMMGVLRWDAELIFMLQKQYLTLPEIKEMVDPDEIKAAMDELEAAKQAQIMDPNAPSPKFNIWIDEEDPENPKVFRGDYRTVQVASQESPDGKPAPSFGKREVVITPDVFDWKGKIHTVADSILTITPTLERTKKLEGYNILIPMFTKPPEMVAKPARSIAKLYSISVEDTFPESWVQYLASVDRGEVMEQPMPRADLGGRPPNVAGGVEDALAVPEDPGFQQERADKVVTNISGQNSIRSAMAGKMNSPM